MPFLKVLFTISLFGSLNLFSQRVTFLNQETKKPIVGVFVFSESNKEGVYSDRKGQIDLVHFEGDQLVNIDHSSYGFRTIPVSDLLKTGVYYWKEKATILPTAYIDHPLRYFLIEEDESAQIQTIDKEIVKIENPATSADMLQNTGNVLVQKSQGGGGSPVIRGFEANKLLLVIDGVRMNNAIYRSGHLQNSITVDNAVLDHTEIIFGPSSSLYGSDALGGVIHFHTKSPRILRADSSYYNGTGYVRYNSNGNGLSAHFDMIYGQNNWGMLTGFTVNRFGDSKMGRNRFHGYDNWGLHREYIDRINGADTILTTEDPNIQLQTGYTQLDLIQKFVYSPSEKWKLGFNFQYSTSTEIHRYDKLTEYSNGQLRWAEWYYGPQNRFLGALRLDISPKSKFLDNGTVQLSYQKVDEDRISRRFQSNGLESQNEDVHVLALNADFNKVYKKNRMIFYGLEVQHNLVSSVAEIRDINSNEVSAAQTRYPDYSNYLNSGVYIEYKKKYKNNAVFHAGARYSLIHANSDFRDTSFISLPFNQVTFTTSAPSGQFGFVLHPDSATTVKSMITSGFRAPNIDDYGKVFENNGNTVVPNDGIKPAYAIGAEFSLARSFFKEFIAVSGTVYGTYVFNAMVRRDFTLNGQDSIQYNGEMTQIQAIINTDHAIIAGVSTSLALNFTKKFNFQYTYNYTYGRDFGSDAPKSHIPPQFGRIAFDYHGEKLKTAIYSFYNFRKDLAEYGGSPDNLDLTPNEEGTPPWWTLNFRVSYKLWDLLYVQAAVENIFDVHYRQFASGISAPGRNFMFGLRTEF